MTMKNILNILSIGLCLMIIASCGLDNFDPPKSQLTGRIVYNGEALQLRGTREAVQVQLYQDGYELNNAISVYVGQDGTFKALLFDGQYKLVTRDNNGPWVNDRDTTIVNVKGNTTVDLNVRPFFTISGSQISLSGNTLSATFTVTQVITTATIQRAELLLSDTQFVDDTYNLFRRDFTSGISPGTVNISADLTGNANVASAKALYGRVAIHTNGASQSLYSPIVRLR